MDKMSKKKNKGTNCKSLGGRSPSKFHFSLRSMKPEKQLRFWEVMTASLLLIVIVLSLGYWQLDQELIGLRAYHSDLVDRYDSLSERYANLVEESQFAALPPYILIKNRTVFILFRASDGSMHRWTTTLENYETTVVFGYRRRESLQYTTLNDSITGEMYRVVDFTPFVDPQPFSEAIPELYNELADDEAFFHEIWYIVTSLTTYSSEITETPRYPLETLVGGGGDCEDFAILIASMLKAAPANYTVQLVYMDAYSPGDAKNVNHLIVMVKTRSGLRTFIDGTSKEVMNPYDGVEGWYFDV